MLYAIKKHSNYIIILALWSVIGMWSTPIAMIVVLGSLIMFFHKGRYFEALFGFFFLLVLSDSLETLFSFSKTIKPIYLVLMSVLMIVKRKDFVFEFVFINRFAPFLLVALACVYYSVAIDVSLQKTVSYLLILFVVPNIVIHEYNRIGPQFFVNLIAFSFIIHLISISIIITFPEVGISHGGRWRGVFGNPNGLGLFLILYYMLFRVVTYNYPQFFTKTDKILYLFVTVLFVWMSGSRNALLSILLFEMIIYGFNYSKPITILLMLAMIFYFDFVVDFIVNYLYSIGLGTSLRLDSVEAGSGRLIAWRFAWEEIMMNTIFFGKGLGYDEYYMRNNFSYLSRLGHEGGVHNTYLILWLNTGLVGLILFFTAFFSFFIKAIKKHKLAFATMVAVLTSITYEPWLSGSLNPYTVVFIILLTVFLFIEDDKKVV